MASGAGDLGASERNWIGYWLVVVLFLRFVRFLPDIVSSRAEKKKGRERNLGQQSRGKKEKKKKKKKNKYCDLHS